MVSRCTGLLAVVAFLTVMSGCTQGQRTDKPGPRMATREANEQTVHLKSYLVGNKRAEIKPDVDESIGMLLTPNTWFRSNHDVSIHVYDNTDGIEHRYDALLGHEADKDIIAEGLVRNTVSCLFVSTGWGLSSGTSPSGESPWVKAEGQGTSLVVRIMGDTDPTQVVHVIYNLDESKHDVKVTWNPDYNHGSEFKLVAPKQCIMVRYNDTQLPDPVSTPGEHQVFLDTVRQRAAIAGITLG